MNVVDNRLIHDIVNSPMDVDLPSSLIVLGLFTILAGGFLAMQIRKERYSGHSQPPTLSE